MTIDDFILKVSTNIWYALLLLSTITLILHGLLVFPKNLSKKSWKKMDYLWLTLTATGLITATDSAGIRTSKNQIEANSHRLHFQLEYLLSTLSPDETSWVCRESIRSEYSPKNYDRIVSGYDNTCAWRSKVYSLVIRTDTINYKAISLSEVPPLDIVDCKECEEYKNNIIYFIEKYNISVNENENNLNNINSRSTYNIIILSPLILILGLALRITKISGELRHDK